MSYIKISDSQRISYFDVDETLISHFPTEEVKTMDYSGIQLNFNGVTRFIYPMHKNIDLISELRLCGYQIAIWSMSGSDHAERIVKLLKIEHLVDVILPKPHLYVDDKPFESQSIPRVFKK